MDHSFLSPSSTFDTFSNNPTRIFQGSFWSKQVQKKKEKHKPVVFSLTRQETPPIPQNLFSFLTSDPSFATKWRRKKMKKGDSGEARVRRETCTLEGWRPWFHWSCNQLPSDQMELRWSEENEARTGSNPASPLVKNQLLNLTQPEVSFSHKNGK